MGVNCLGFRALGLGFIGLKGFSLGFWISGVELGAAI